MNRFILLSLVVILISGIIFAISWIYIDGTEISCLEAVSDQYTGFVDKTLVSFNNYDSVSHTLTEDQILQLKQLLLDSRFRRNLSHSYSYNGLHDTYSLFLECDDSQGRQVAFIQIFIIEDLYISITSPYTDERFTMKILDNQFCDVLDRILFGPYPYE